MQAAETLAAEFSDAGAPYRHKTRRVLLKKFKFSLVYVPYENEVLVLAIVPFPRRPAYGKDRRIDAESGSRKFLASGPHTTYRAGSLTADTHLPFTPAKASRVGACQRIPSCSEHMQRRRRKVEGQHVAQGDVVTLGLG